MSIDEKKIAPFLFDGEKIDVRGDSVVDTGPINRAVCTIRVDGRLVISLEVDKVDQIYDPMAELDSFRFTNRRKMAELPFAGVGALGDSNSMVSTGCSGAAADFLIAYVVVDGAVKDDVAGRRKALEAFTVDFVPKVKRALGCTV
ncbi:hypothetical protein ACWCWD_11605 [Streptomyces sp. NPDC001493]